MSASRQLDPADSRFNVARYFTENRSVAWVFLVATLVWGAFAYVSMPKAKDPAIPIRIAMAICPWPGASADRIEQLVTPKLEARIAENPRLDRVESTSRSGVATFTIVLKEGLPDVGREFDDIKTRLDGIRDLPEGAGPIQFIKDFGDTATLLLTVASPSVNEVELSLRLKELQRVLKPLRESGKSRATAVLNFSTAVDAALMNRRVELVAQSLLAQRLMSEVKVLRGAGFALIDGVPNVPQAQVRTVVEALMSAQGPASDLHPDVWPWISVGSLDDLEAALRSAAQDRYSFRELDQYSELLQRHLQSLPLVSKVTRSGQLPETIFLDYSQERLAAHGFQATSLSELLAARNITAPGGVAEIAGQNVTLDASGAFRNLDDLGNVVAMTSASGAPVYLRDLVDIRRDYQSPPRFLNFVSIPHSQGSWTKSKAITLAVLMRPGSQINDFAVQVNTRLAEVKRLLPEDLIIRRTSDQPQQVQDTQSLFMTSLWEAILLVVLVGLIGFWEWRSALLLALSIPITLAMTFGFMHMLGLDVQQISIASLILALGLLVDDPVVASDAIKTSIQSGMRPRVAAWVGPTQLAQAILFATITNIVAYLPLLLVSGDVGRFIYSLPLVITASLVASRLVSMTFIPLLGGDLLRAPQAPNRRPSRVLVAYRRALQWTIPNRKKMLLVTVLLVGAGFASATKLKLAFFPTDLSYLSYVDVWLPENASLSATREVVTDVEAVIRQTADRWAQEHGRGEPVLKAITSFLGGGAPRFWFSVLPEQSQINYAQLIVEVRSREDTHALVPVLQEALSSRVPGALVDVRQLENGRAVGVPVAIRLSGEDTEELRRQAEKAKAIFRSLPDAERVRDDWGVETLGLNLEVDADRANLAGVTNLDVARSTSSAMSGRTVGVLREGDRQIPIVTRLRLEERALLKDVENLYVSAGRGTGQVPLRQIAQFSYGFKIEKLKRRNQFRTITVSCFPTRGVLPSQLIRAATPALQELEAQLPPGYRLEVGGEQEARKTGFTQLAIAMVISILAIFLALVIQFRSAVKPLIVFATIPFGIAGALFSLRISGAPFGFMAFLGIVSLMGVIVSHVIVKFEFIEEQREKGLPLHEALIEAGAGRVRPVLVTVGATVLGLVPLAARGGPLWEPLCYAQMGGLLVATVLTLFLIPVLYTVAIEDLGIMSWSPGATQLNNEANPSDA